MTLLVCHSDLCGVCYTPLEFCVVLCTSVYIASGCNFLRLPCHPILCPICLKLEALLRLISDDTIPVVRDAAAVVPLSLDAAQMDLRSYGGSEVPSIYVIPMRPMSMLYVFG